MSRLLLCIDLSPSRPWLFTTIVHNRDLLLRHGIELGQLDSWRSEQAPAHNHFWVDFLPACWPNPHIIRERFANLACQLNAGHDVLLMTFSPTMEAHQAFAAYLKENVVLKGHTISYAAVAGSPVCTFEQRYREYQGLLWPQYAMACVRRYSTLGSLLGAFPSLYGRDALLLPDLSGSPVAHRQEHLARQLFSWLGVPQADLPDVLPFYAPFLPSCEARALSWLVEPRYNAFPDVDAHVIMQTLLKLDKDWNLAPISPLKYRRAFASAGAEDAARLESILGVEKGSFAAPDWLLQPEGPAADKPLEQDAIRAFVDALPAPEAAALQQRLANDADVLDANQKNLARALDGKCKHGMRIGEPVPPPMLTVLTMTYNHEAYIAKCMDSVLMQQTDFPVQHIVLDHHSSDATASIVAAYAARHASIRPVLLSYRCPAENVMGLFLRCHSRYVALCDGDDYFTDPFKLQKQVSYLDNNPDCALCFHPVMVVHENGQQADAVFPAPTAMPGGVREKYTLKDLLGVNFIQTNSVCYRWRFGDGLPNWFRADLCPGDWYWHLLHAEMGNIGFLPDVMATYRRHDTAWYATTDISLVEHRKKHGMRELITYDAINSHFKDKYLDVFSRLTNGVLANFLQISQQENSPDLLNQAVEKFPKFAGIFLQQLKNVSVPNG